MIETQMLSNFADSFKEHMQSSETDSDVFEITDFTTASDWERFVASLEEIFNDWKLAGNGAPIEQLKKGDIAAGEWRHQSETLTFADFQFSVTRHTLTLKEEQTGKKEEEPENVKTQEECDDTPLPAAFYDVLNSSNDFPAKAHCLARWFGVRDFVVIACANPGEFVSSESRVKILLSSINIAVNNTGCPLPVFLETDRPQRQLYFGVCEGAGMKMDFEMACLKRYPSNLRYLSGLVDMFQKKLGCSITASPKISVSLRFTYVINNWPLSLTSCVVEDTDDRLDFKRLRTGPLEDPINNLILAATWPCVDSLLVADSENYSDLDPLAAPQWHLRADFEDRPPCNLWDTLRQYMKLCKRQETMNDMFPPRGEDAAGAPTFSRAIERLTESRVAVPTISSAVERARFQLQRRWMENPPLADDFIEELLEFIFTDEAASTMSQSMGEEEEEYEDEEDTVTATTTTDDNMGRTWQQVHGRRMPESRSIDSAIEELDKSLEKQFKCAPIHSLAHRLAVGLAAIIPGGGMHAVAQLWQEVLMELRTRWDAGLFITNLGPDAAPDLGTSLFNQKLQMLNCCIAKKVAAEMQREDTSENKLEIDMRDEDEDDEMPLSDEDEEFYECRSETPTEAGIPRSPVADVRPRGRSHQHGSLYLLRHEEEPLFVPFTQEAAPLTEDAVEEQAKRLAGLGTTAEAASQRARMQCGSLMSDMESFKAANPRCCLEDFVRWYSPRDFVTDAQGVGKLSQRMEVPGNLWVEAWREAGFSPARRQKRLFDETAEAEKVFRFLDDLGPGQLCFALLPNLLAEALRELHRSFDPELGPAQLPSLLEALLDRAGRATRSLEEGPERFEEVFRRLAHAEVLVSRARSLAAKLASDRQPDLLAFVRAALSASPEVVVTGGSHGPVGAAVQRLMAECREQEEQPVLAEPSGKEYLLRSELSMPGPGSRPGPQRLFCAVQKDDCRLCGAFARDTMFY